MSVNMFTVHFSIRLDTCCKSGIKPYLSWFWLVSVCWHRLSRLTAIIVIWLRGSSGDEQWVIPGLKPQLALQLPHDLCSAVQNCIG
jgi:hypothetical protein